MSHPAPIPTVVELWHNRSGLRIDLNALLMLQQSGALESVLGAVVLLDRMGEEYEPPMGMEEGEGEGEEEGEPDETGDGSALAGGPPPRLPRGMRPPTFQELWQRFLESRGQDLPPDPGKQPGEPDPPGVAAGGR